MCGIDRARQQTSKMREISKGIKIAHYCSQRQSLTCISITIINTKPIIPAVAIMGTRVRLAINSAAALNELINKNTAKQASCRFAVIYSGKVPQYQCKAAA